jgi:nitrite reductase (NADH) large subunit
LSNVLASSDDSSEIYLNALDWYTDNNVDLRAGVRVVRLDPYARLVHADDDSTTSYDTLILASGSRSFFPRSPGCGPTTRR